jgi:hypothetical protein
LADGQGLEDLHHMDDHEYLAVHGIDPAALGVAGLHLVALGAQGLEGLGEEEGQEEEGQEEEGQEEEGQEEGLESEDLDLGLDQGGGAALAMQRQLVSLHVKTALST